MILEIVSASSRLILLQYHFALLTTFIL